MMTEMELRNMATLGLFLLLFGWELINPFFPFFRGQGRAYRTHFMRNLLFGLFNGILIGAVFLGLWRWATDLSVYSEFGLLYWIRPPHWLHSVLAFVLLDVWTYWWHRANHRIPFFWRFHRMHHSDPWMDVTTARRFHPGEIIFSSLLRIPLLFLFGLHLWELFLYGWLMGLVVDFHHANIVLPERLERWLRLFIVTPAMHKVHHSYLQPETDSNYTSLLSIWDRLFMSFRLRTDLRAIRIGLDGWSDFSNQTLRGMLKTPFKGLS